MVPLGLVQTVRGDLEADLALVGIESNKIPSLRSRALASCAATQLAPAGRAVRVVSGSFYLLNDRTDRCGRRSGGARGSRITCG